MIFFCFYFLEITKLSGILSMNLGDSGPSFLSFFLSNTHSSPFGYLSSLQFFQLFFSLLFIPGNLLLYLKLHWLARLLSSKLSTISHQPRFFFPDIFLFSFKMSLQCFWIFSVLIQNLLCGPLLKSYFLINRNLYLFL